MIRESIGIGLLTTGSVFACAGVELPWSAAPIALGLLLLPPAWDALVWVAHWVVIAAVIAADAWSVATATPDPERHLTLRSRGADPGNERIGGGGS